MSQLHVMPISQSRCSFLSTYKIGSSLFSLLTFKQPPDALRQEIGHLLAALRTPCDSLNSALSSAANPIAVTNTPSQTSAGASSASTAPTAANAPADPLAEFYSKLFQHLAFDVQHQILVLGHQTAAAAAQLDTTDPTATSAQLVDHCRLVLLLMRRFPASTAAHAPRLLDLLMQGYATVPTTSSIARSIRELLINEALPLVRDCPTVITVTPSTVAAMIATAFEHHICSMFAKPAPPPDQEDGLVHEHWHRLLETLRLCGRILRWEVVFPGYERNDSKDQYWKSVCQIVTVAGPRPSETHHTQIAFCATILFVMALQRYMRDVQPRTAGQPAFVLIEAVRELRGSGAGGGEHGGGPSSATAGGGAGAVDITATALPCSTETAVCLATAANCWHLLHSVEQLQLDFSKLLRSVPLGEWIARFLVDLAVYVGSAEEARLVLAKDAQVGQLERNVRLLSVMGSGGLQAPLATSVPALFECMLAVLADAQSLPPGEFVAKMASTAGGSGAKHLVLLPLTRHAVVQYCTRLLVGELRARMVANERGCSDTLLGDLLVLLQLDWPAEYELAEQVFAVILDRGAFTYLQFGKYIVCADFIEQFMSMWYPHGGDVSLVFVVDSADAATADISQRRIGTRGADKGHQAGDFPLVMRRQMAKSADADVGECVRGFVVAEQVQLMQHLYEQ